MSSTKKHVLLNKSDNSSFTTSPFRNTEQQKELDNKKLKYLNFSQVTQLSANFMLLYIPFNVTQNTMTELLSKHFGDLGFVT